MLDVSLQKEEMVFDMALPGKSNLDNVKNLNAEGNPAPRSK